ncbi:MAG: PH domain-containing protein [Wenzhouxiangellaceae bacterium]|nr:PH domain-containing protein [Wenzhouxiangellaceae bacterium]
MSDPHSPWKALPIAAVAALYISGMQRFIRENLVVFFGAGTGFAISESLGWREFVLAAAAALLVGLLVAMIYHRRFRYRLDEDSVRVRKGLLEQQELKVRLERIQNVGFSQPLYLKPVGLVRVTLETPGAAQSEVNLPGISLEEAKALRDRISSGTAPSGQHATETPVDPAGFAGSEPGPASRVRFEASASDLFRYGMTSNQVWILLALLGAPVSNWIESRMSHWIEQLRASGVLDLEVLQGAPLLVAVLVGLAIFAGALLIMTVSGLLAIVRFGGFKLLLEGDRFKSRFGMLDAREKTLRTEKIHSIEIGQTMVGRLLDQWHAVGHQTGGDQTGQEYREDRRFLVPGIDAARLSDVLDTLRNGSWTTPEWQGVDRRFRSMFWERTVVAGTLAALASWWLVPDQAPWLTSSFVVIVAVVVVAVHLVWRRWGYALDDKRIRVRYGMIGKTIVEFDMFRCQQVGIKTSPYQRRHGLASLTLTLPHGEQRIPYIERRTAEKIANLVLYRVETSLKHRL